MRIRTAGAALLCVMALGAPPALAGARPCVADINRSLIPKSCASPRMAVIERKEMATAMSLGPADARVVRVTREIAGDLGSIEAGPGLITCPVFVKFSNGIGEIGYFSIWVQQSGELEVGWGENPLPFGPQYRNADKLVGNGPSRNLR